MRQGVVSLKLGLGKELGWGEIAEGLVRAGGVVGALPSKELAVEGGDLETAGGDLIELLVVGAVGGLDVVVEFR